MALFFGGKKPSRKLSYEELEGKLASEYVKRGNMLEKMLPLQFFKNGMKYYDTGELLFFGKPIDYIWIKANGESDDEVIFMEFKSGSADLNPKEKRLKELIERGKVRWVEIRV